MIKTFRIIPILLLTFVAACSSVSEEEQAAIDNCMKEGTRTDAECKCMVTELFPTLTDQEKVMFLSEEENKGDMETGFSVLGKVMAAMGSCGISME